MLEKTPSFEEIIQKDRETRKSESWHGTFLEYLDKVKSDPSICHLAHSRLYKAVVDHGITDLADSEDPAIRRLFPDEHLKTYAFFQQQFFGIERPISQIVRYLQSAAMQGEESRQVLYLMGPVGAGKSSLVMRLQKALEQSPPFFAIEGCPIKEEPLHLIPEQLRDQFRQLLGVSIEGELCPVCRYRLAEEFQGKYEEVPIGTYRFSKQQRVGMGIVPPVDPNNQDTSVLIGSEDISKLDRYSESDPRVLDLSGAFNVGNRGMVEFIEVFKNEVEYLHTMITATQEKFVPAPGRHGTVYTDTVIVAHSNEAEWRKFKADHTNEAILDRVVVVKAPYNLRLSQEIKIYQKMLGVSNFVGHIAPHTLEIASLFAILTRLAPTAKCDPMTKVRLYDGEEVVLKGSTLKLDVRALMEEHSNEGMTGVSTRFIMKALDNALADSVQGINPINVRESLINMVKAEDIAEDVRKTYLEFLQDSIHKGYLEILEKEVTRAFVYSFDEQADNLFQNYLDHAEAFVNKNKVKDADTGEELAPDETFLASVEEQIGITGSAAEGFRQEVMVYLWAATRRGEKVSYGSYEPLKDAIEKRLLHSVRDMSRLVTKSRTRDEEQRKKYNDLVEGMIHLGYDEHSAEVVLKYAANNLWKD